MRVFAFLAGLVASCATPIALLGQWPGEMRGVVRDGLTGSPVAGAIVVFADARHTVTDASGTFHHDGLPPGPSTLRVDAPGYIGLRLDHTVANGRVDYLDVVLQPNPLTLAPLEAFGRRAIPGAGNIRHLKRAEVASSGARTLGDAVKLLPSAIVRDRGMGSAQTISVRGSDADAVLVLIDGIPLNDPVTGEADLSSVTADVIESVTLHVGASSARFGGRATAGVLEVTTGATDHGWIASLGTGSLGSSEVRLERASTLGRWDAGVSAGHGSVDGDFGFALPSEVGGGRGLRRNADQTLTSIQLFADRLFTDHSLSDHPGPTSARIRIGVDHMDRGLPGPGFNPSINARQETRSARASVNVGRTLKTASVRSLAYVSHTRRRFQDEAPPAGLPYDEDARLTDAALELLASWTGHGAIGSIEVGTTTRSQWIVADALDEGAVPTAIVDLGAFGAASFDPGVGGAQVHARFRIDRAGPMRQWKASHGLTLAVPRGPFSFELSHRSAFNPPTLADQFFREGVGVRANPDLQAERIPSEFEFATRFARERVQASLSAYTGDVKGRIVWQPDFRFVWGPTNTDVRRRGIDASLALQPAKPLSLRSSYTYARTTYDRVGTADSVQLAYRPRHAAAATARWSARSWSFDAATFYTGRRFPVPAPVNALPAFVSVDLSASRTWTRASWSTEVVARVHRALDTHDSLIFGFPDPGRTFALEVRVHRNTTP